MNKPKKLSLTRTTLVPVGAKQSKQVQDGGDRTKTEIRTTSICPFICW